MPRRPLGRHVTLAGAVLALAAPFGGAILSSPAAAAPTLASTTTAHAIRAVETEYHVALNRTRVPAGRYTITAVNKGTIEHGLVVNGPGLHDKLIGIVKPGHTASKVVTLRKGRYDIFCPISDHKMIGMNTHLTVS